MENFDKIKLKKFKIKSLNPDATILLFGRRRTGKCLGKDTGILMFDGSIKKVQDVQLGESVMGDDSTPRKVLGLNNGLDRLYKITNQRNESYVVNSEHILSLKYTKKLCWFDKLFRNIECNKYKYVDIPIEKYISLPIKEKNKLNGYQVPIKFDHKNVDLDLDPYILGFWLGNGNENTISITKTTVVKYFDEYLSKHNCCLNKHVIDKTKYKVNQSNNYFSNVLEKYDVLDDKHIPNVYKYNTRQYRLQLLAGLLDANGTYDNGILEYSDTLENENLISDIVYLAKSLGFVCHKNKIYDYLKDIKWNIRILSKNLTNIPTKVLKISRFSCWLLNVKLDTPIRVKQLPMGEYYGFELDGNHRFVLDSFIVTHNSFLARDIFYHHKEIPTGIVFSATEEANPFFGKFIPDSFIHPEYRPDLVSNLMVSQSHKVKSARNNGFDSTDGKHPGNRTFVVLDDMLADAASWKKDKTIKEIFFNGRHYNIFFILTMQYPVGIPPELRGNIDYVFIFNEPSIGNRKKLFDNYGGILPSFDHFCNILDSCTQNHECLVIKTCGVSNNLNDQLFWYKASAHDDFRVGHPTIWKFHEQNYNNRYDRERDIEQEEVNRLKKKFNKTHKLKIFVSRTGDIKGEKLESE